MIVFFNSENRKTDMDKNQMAPQLYLKLQPVGADIIRPLRNTALYSGG